MGTIGLAVVLGGCRGDAAQGVDTGRSDDAADPQRPLALDPPPTPRAAVPETEAEFLERLLPLPSPTVRVVYRLEGPGGLTGSLEVWARPGGWRREAWRVDLGGPAGEVEADTDDGDQGTESGESGESGESIGGLTIQTPESLWSATGDDAGERRPAGLDGLARAYLKLEPAQRTQVMSAIDGWYADMALARSEAPGERDEVAGVACMRTRVAAQNVCVWESAGLPLAYEGAEFRLEATRVDTDMVFPEDAFTPPERAKAAAYITDDPQGPAALDPQKALERLAQGDRAPLALVLTPGFRVPASTVDR